MIVSSAEKAVGVQLSEDHKRLVVTFCTEGITGIIIDWIKGEIKLDKASTVKYISSIFRNGLPAIILRTN